MLLLFFLMFCVGALLVVAPLGLLVGAAVAGLWVELLALLWAKVLQLLRGKAPPSDHAGGYNVPPSEGPY